MAYDNGYDNEYGSTRRSSGDSSVPLTADDARHEYEKVMRGSGLQGLSLQRDQDGNSRVLGFKIPKELLPAVETALPNAITWLQRVGSEFSHDKALWLTSKLKLKDTRAAAIAKAAEYGVRWGLVAARPITDAIHIAKTHSRERKALFKEFKPVIEATGVDYKHNEVVRNAFDELHCDMVDNVKLMSADLLTLAPMIYIGVKDQKAAAAKRKKMSPGESGDFAAEMEQMRKEHAQELERDRKIAELRERTITEQMAIEGQTLTAEEIGERFDRFQYRRENELRWQRRNEKQQPEKESSLDGTGSQLAILGLSLGSQIVKANIRENAERHEKTTNAWKMIKHLKEEVDAQLGAGMAKDSYGFEGNSADNLRVSLSNGDEVSLREYILEIFQQHERDRLPFDSKQGAEARQKINPLGPALVEKLMPTIDIIAEYIAEDRLNPYALVNLVGDNKVVIHESNGARRFAQENAVEGMINELLAVMGTHESVKPEEFFANFADPALIQNTLKQNLETLQGKEKTFFVSLFPDEILEQAGMKKKDIIEHRRAAHDIMYDTVAASTLSIAAHDGETLKKFGLSEKEIESIQTLAEKIEAGDERAVKVAVDGHDKSALAAIRTAGLNAQAAHVEGGESFWTRMVEKAKSVPDLISEAKKRREAEPAAREPSENFVERASREEQPLAGPRVG